MRLLALLTAIGFAAAPLRAIEVAPVRVEAPVGAGAMGAAAVGAQAGTLTNPGLSGLAAASISAQLPASLVPSVIPTAQEPAPAPQAEGYAAPVAAPQAVTAVPISVASTLAPAGSVASLQQTARPSNTSAAALPSLQGLAARMEAGRVSGQDLSGDSQQFFDQSGIRGPPLAESAQASVPVSATPKLPKGIKKVAVDIVRTAADVDRLLPQAWQSHNPYVREYLQELNGDLKRDVAKMAPYQVYTYYDFHGGRTTGIDVSAHPAIVDLIPDIRPHEIRLIKKLMLVDSDIRVLVREDGKTPDLVIGDKLVEMKSFSGDNLPLEALVDKANGQVSEHARHHGLGRGALALDLVREERVPVSRVQDVLNSWQSEAHGPVVLDQVFVFGQKDMRIFVRQEDGTYQVAAPVLPARSVANGRTLAPAEKGKAQAMLRNGFEKSSVLALSL
jgi:hypothetical protein